jgi:hypothetical protein
MLRYEALRDAVVVSTMLYLAEEAETGTRPPRDSAPASPSDGCLASMRPGMGFPKRAHLE